MLQFVFNLSCELSHNLHQKRNFRYRTTQNSSSVQNAIGGLFTDIIGFVQEKEFHTCIEEDDEWINILITELCSRKKDLYNTESAIVVSGKYL